VKSILYLRKRLQKEEEVVTVGDTYESLKGDGVTERQT
jgi:hypothetical protein